MTAIAGCGRKSLGQELRKRDLDPAVTAGADESQQRSSADSRDGSFAARPTVWQGRLLAGSLQTIGPKQKSLRTSSWLPEWTRTIS
jgi:hypothetical protein